MCNDLELSFVSGRLHDRVPNLRFKWFKLAPEHKINVSSDSNQNPRASFWRFRGRGGRNRNQGKKGPSGRFALNSSIVVDDPTVVNHEPVVLVKPSEFSPFPGWLHYFPGQNYDADAPIVKHTKAFIEYLKQECLSEVEDRCLAPFHLVDWALVEDHAFINVDFASLKSSSTLAEKLPGWLNDLNLGQKLNAKQLLQCLSLAVHTVAMEKLYGPKNTLHSRDTAVKIPFIAARLIDHQPFTPMRSLRAHHLGNLVSLRATVAKLGPCIICGYEQVLVAEEEGFFVNPTKCPEKGCRSKRFTPLFNSPSTQVIDSQTLLLQESDEDASSQEQQITTGRVPRNITCFVDRDLVDSCLPGDFVHVCGIVSLLSATAGGGGFHSSGNRRPFGSAQEASSSKTNVFNLCIRVNNLTRIYGRAGENTGDYTKPAQCLTTRRQECDVNERLNVYGSNELSEIQTADIHFSLSDLYAIRGIAEEANLFNHLVASFCPSICGRELVKMAILLAMFGGSPSSWGVRSRGKYMASSPGGGGEEETSDLAPVPFFDDLLESGEDVFARRSSSHVLIVGDPGIGKSQLLRAAANVAPRAIYVCGNTTSAAGLTVTTTRDSSSLGLEAGALVLADQGVCCIDEFDKISCDPAALLEVLEQQTVSVARGGYVCNLAARTSVLAAANPVVGRYDPSKTVYENVRVSRSLISRFDLIFILPDRPSESLDLRLSEHVLALHMGLRSNEGGFVGSSPSTAHVNLAGENASLESRLRTEAANREPIPLHLLRKYIAYAKAYVYPKMTLEAARHIHQFYLNLRSLKKSQSDLFQVTIRQLESLIRLASARARAELREEITKQDAQDVCDLMLETGYGKSQSFAVTPSIPPIKKRKNASSTGVAATKRLLTALQREASKRGNNRDFTTQEIAGIVAQIGLSDDDSVLYQRSKPGGNLSILIDNLNNIGALLKRGVDQYHLT